MPRIISALSSPGHPWKPGTRDKKIRQATFEYEASNYLTAAMIRQAAKDLGKAPKLMPSPIIHPEAMKEYSDYLSFSDLMAQMNEDEYYKLEEES